MLKPQDRRGDIAARITREGAMSVEALAALYDVSLETIRRDLARLSDEGRIRKVHGGARPQQLHAEASFAVRMTEDTGEKLEIGRKLAREVRPGDTLFLDTGSTTLIAGKALAGIPGLTIVTNSLLIAQNLGGASEAEVFLLGGAYGPANHQTLGAMVLDQIAQFQVDRAVLTLTGIDATAGVTFGDNNEAEVARAMTRRAESTTFLAHSSKFGRRAPHRICALDRIDTLLVATAPPDPLAAALDVAGVRVPE